jgi:hypothetical protein
MANVDGIRIPKQLGHQLCFVDPAYVTEMETEWIIRRRFTPKHRLRITGALLNG